MDNNFDENNSGAFPAEEHPEQSSAPQPPQESIPHVQPQENIPPRQPNGFVPQQYVLPQYNPDMGAYTPPPAEKQKPAQKSFTGGCFWTLISAIFVMFVTVIILAAAIAVRDVKPKNIGGSSFTADTEKAEHAVIRLPRAEKPVLSEEMYRNKETGLLTTVGVAEMVLPSQVKINIFDEMPYFPVSSGSGVILTADGYILTNAHVVDGARQIAVIFYDGSEEVGTLVGIDKKSDLAVISVNRGDLIPAELGISSTLVVGEEVALAGAGGGFENTVTYGHVTGLDRQIDTDYMSSSTIHCIQTDAALNPGNSGGALVNMYGQVVGVAVALMNHETYENIGFSIAVDDAIPIAEELIAHGYVTSRTRVGITYLSIGDASANGYGIAPGLCVINIDPQSGAVDSGLMPYDVITEIDGHRVFGAEEIVEALSDKIPGDTVTLTVFRKTVTEEIFIFETEVVLTPDMSSTSGYSVEQNETDYFERDIIK